MRIPACKEQAKSKCVFCLEDKADVRTAEIWIIAVPVIGLCHKRGKALHHPVPIAVAGGICFSYARG